MHRCRCLQEARGVPQLGGEVAVALDPLLIELDVAALAFHRRQREAQRVGAIFVDQAERIDRIALRLGHFLPVRVADQAVEIERLPRHLVENSMPCIAIRASQKKRMSKPEMSTSLG
jgi:hypothetical protein